MVNKGKKYPVPKFDNLKEEDKYWRSHSPLLEGYEGKVQKKKQNRASFLSIRLTGEELAQLREKATHYGLGPSTYARQVLIRAMESGEVNLPPELLFQLCCLQYGRLTDQQQEKYFQQLNKIYEEYQEMQNMLANRMLTLRPPDSLSEPVNEFIEEDADH